MYNGYILTIEILCSTIIIFRSIQIAVSLDFEQWKGHPLKFIGNSIAYPFLMGGSLFIILNRGGGFILLLVGVMLLMMSDRRRAR